jgi:proteasome lid subunit RPN8/RPN11
VILTPAELAAIERQALEEYPSECCGVVVGRGEERRLLRFRNIQDSLHAVDPQRYPRTSRTAYTVGKDDFERLERVHAEGFTLAVIYHSHIDAGAYFSETDKRMALMGQDPRHHDPLYPDAIYVVVSVVDNQVEAVAAFRWDGVDRDFRPVPLEMAARGERVQ